MRVIVLAVTWLVCRGMTHKVTSGGSSKGSASQGSVLNASNGNVHRQVGALNPARALATLFLAFNRTAGFNPSFQVLPCSPGRARGCSIMGLAHKPSTSRKSKRGSKRNSAQKGGLDAKDGEVSWLEDAWQKYVLIRPGMTFKELQNSTKLRTYQYWTWENRTPGTARTLVITSVVLILAAIPVLLTNPAVFPKLIELAALSRAGVTPLEFFKETGSFW
mmetsp:Transcript_161326/g.297581  ORF Transcript_161326/g.297581 Transcript_161326/m.297581 type:complete len:219 (+) Transcript_161326:126-782(+)